MYSTCCGNSQDFLRSLVFKKTVTSAMGFPKAGGWFRLRNPQSTSMGPSWRYKLQIKAKGVEKTSAPTISWGDVESFG